MISLPLNKTSNDTGADSQAAEDEKATKAYNDPARVAEQLLAQNSPNKTSNDTGTDSQAAEDEAATKAIDEHDKSSNDVLPKNLIQKKGHGNNSIEA